MIDATHEQDPIEHVVLLMLENHSFDQMLGCFTARHPELEGVDPQHPRSNAAPDGTIYQQAETRERQMQIDPKHEVPHVRVQLADGNAGFVRDLVTAYGAQCTQEQCRYVMGYYPLGFLPALHTLAEQFTICDHWFSSLPGPTWPNRFFALTGTSMGRVNMPDDGTHTKDVRGYFQQDQDTIFDRLSERCVPWRIYFHSVPQTLVLRHQRRPANAAQYYPIDRFFADARGLASEFPAFALIEPDFMGAAENDDHPPHDIMKAQQLIADVYNALRSNPELWARTLLVITYDEHGGFYDHVTPPPAVPPDDHHEEYTFDQLGVRVPALLVSPWVEAGVDPTVYDHTSLLRYLIDKWGLEPLGRRATAANSFAHRIRRTGAPRADTVPWIALTKEQLTPPRLDVEEDAEDHRSGHHEALDVVLRYLEHGAERDGPTLFATISRLFERVAARFRAPISLPMSPPAQRREQAMDTVMHYVRRQRPHGVAQLITQLRDPGTTSEARRFAAERIARIVGVRIAAGSDPVPQVDQWLTRHGR